MSNATSSRSSVTSVALVAPASLMSASAETKRAAGGARTPHAPTPPKLATVAFAVADISALAKSLRVAFERGDAAPTQVQMLNWLAKAAGHQNYQSLRAQASSVPHTLHSPCVIAVAETAVTVKVATIKSKKIESDAALSTHAAKALTQFDSDGKLTRWPHKFAVQRVAMWGLWIRFDSKRRYTEKEVNSVLNAWHLFGDHATLRRELINMDLLARKPDCSAYWKNTQQPSDEIQAFLRALRRLAST